MIAEPETMFAVTPVIDATTSPGSSGSPGVGVGVSPGSSGSPGVGVGVSPGSSGSPGVGVGVSPGSSGLGVGAGVEGVVVLPPLLPVSYTQLTLPTTPYE